MIHIKIGYKCGDNLHCDMRKKCKYRPKWYKLHNMSINIHRFFDYRLHIKLPHLFFISQRWERLSGTKKCPYHKSRNYTCFDCKYVGGNLCRECYNKERNDTPYDKRIRKETEWGSQCGYFEKCEWADDYKGNSGK